MPYSEGCESYLILFGQTSIKWCLAMNTNVRILFVISTCFNCEIKIYLSNFTSDKINQLESEPICYVVTIRDKASK